MYTLLYLSAVTTTQYFAFLVFATISCRPILFWRTSIAETSSVSAAVSAVVFSFVPYRVRCWMAFFRTCKLLMYDVRKVLRRQEGGGRVRKGFRGLSYGSKQFRLIFSCTPSYTEDTSVFFNGPILSPRKLGRVYRCQPVVGTTCHSPRSGIRANYQTCATLSLLRR